MAEQRAHPQRVGRPPVVPVAVQDQGGVPADASVRHQPREAGPVDVVAGDRVVELGVPVELHGPWDMARLIQQHILIGLGDDETRILQVLGQPFGRDEHLRARIVLEFCCGIIGKRHDLPHLR
jgi:hypothetical protein